MPMKIKRRCLYFSKNTINFLPALLLRRTENEYILCFKFLTFHMGVAFYK